MGFNIKAIVSIAFIFLFLNNHAQTVVKQDAVLSTLTYHPEIPPVNSYVVVKNSTGQQLPDSVLLKINFYRRMGENYLWKVNEKVEVLIYPVSATKEENKK